MKHKGLIIISIVFFVIVNTMPLWDGNLGIFAFLIFLVLIGVYFILGLAFIGQLRKTIKKKFKDNPRIITLTILGLVLTITFFRPFGVVDYEKFEGADVLVAEAEGVASCMTTFKLKDDYTFKEKSICFGTKEIKGKYYIDNDTIFFDNVKLNRFTDKYYKCAVIETDKYDEIQLYLINENDSIKRGLDIVVNDLDKMKK